MARRGLKLTLAFVVGLTLLIGAGAWMFLRVDDIPEQLPPVQLDPQSIVIQGVGGGPPLAIAELKGQTAFFVVVGVQSLRAKEGEALNRALNRWNLPATTKGFIVGDAEGFELFKSKVGEFMAFFGKEMRYPAYLDFEGVFMRTFELPKGHHGFVVLGPDGTIAMRKSGGIDDPAELERVRTLLGATEPPPGPEAPDFEVGELDDETCKDKVCAIAFLGSKVSRKDIPGIDDGFEGEREQVFAQFEKPDVRMASTVLSTKLEKSTKDAMGVLVGSTEDLEFEGWDTVEEANEARQAFGIAPDAAAFVVVSEGRVAFSGTGSIPMYRWGEVADLLGVELREPGRKDEE